MDQAEADQGEDDDGVVQRVAALDVGKAEVVCCVRLPGPGGRRRQEVTTHPTTTRALGVLADRLAEIGVTRVVMEATSDYWKPPFYVLEAHGLNPWLVNARDVKHLPGRAKTDKLDAAWLCKVAERGMLRPSFVPPAPIRRLRDLTRYRTDLITARTSEKQRVEKLLEDAGIKVSVVASDIFGVSGRAMLGALVAGERDPRVLAELARGSMRRKTSQLEEAFTGFFTDHHAFLLGKMLARVDGIDGDIDDIDSKIDQVIAPFGDAVARLVEIPGINRTIAAVIIAEIGVDMTRFPTAGHLASWARFSPRANQSAGKSKASTTGHGNRYLARALGQAAAGAARTDTFLGQRYGRLIRRAGKKKALVAVARSILTIIWHVLADPNGRYIDLGPDFYDKRVNAGRQTRALVAKLEALGHKVTLQPAA